MAKARLFIWRDDFSRWRWKIRCAEVDCELYYIKDRYTTAAEARDGAYGWLTQWMPHVEVIDDE